MFVFCKECGGVEGLLDVLDGIEGVGEEGDVIVLRVGGRVGEGGKDAGELCSENGVCFAVPLGVDGVGPVRRCEVKGRAYAGSSLGGGFIRMFI